jgi:hypothetical protein
MVIIIVVMVGLEHAAIPILNIAGMQGVTAY